VTRYDEKLKDMLKKVEAYKGIGVSWDFFFFTFWISNSRSIKKSRSIAAKNLVK
jgi:hypothetical protein